MKNNELNFESLYSEALGISDSNKPVFSQSNEGFDGFDDALEVEIAKGFESLNFIDTYTAMQQKNSAEMIRMCKKLSVNYGLKSGVNEKAAKSIESLCNVYSTEDENKDGEKKEGVFKRVLESLRTIFSKIRNFFIKIFQRIKDFFVRKGAKDIKGDLEKDSINDIINDENIWNNAPKEIIIAGEFKVYEFNSACTTLLESTMKIEKTLTTGNGNVENHIFEPFDRLADTQKDWTKAQMNMHSTFGVMMNDSSDHTCRKQAVEWAGKASNLKYAIEGIEVAERGINNINKSCELIERYCDKLKDKINDKNFGDDYSDIIKLFKPISENMNRSRNEFSRVVKAIMFADKLYLYGKKR